MKLSVVLAGQPLHARHTNCDIAQSMQVFKCEMHVLVAGQSDQTNTL